METAEEDECAISICSTSEADEMEDSARTTLTGASSSSTSYYNQVTGQVVDMAAAHATAVATGSKPLATSATGSKP
eukprot:3109052-Amphidinium_carterae.1